MIVNAYGERRQTEVMEDTWGHLRPGKGTFPGWMLAACSAYGGERLLIDDEFSGVPSSPWLYDAMVDAVESADMKEGAVYRFEGTCTATGTGHVIITGTWVQVATTRIVKG